MNKIDTIKIFEDKQVRTLWDENQEKWFISIVDVVFVLVQSKDYQTARKYWNKLKQRLKAEGNETVTNCHGLKSKFKKEGSEVSEKIGRLKRKASDGKIEAKDDE